MLNLVHVRHHSGNTFSDGVGFALIYYNHGRITLSTKKKRQHALNRQNYLLEECWNVRDVEYSLNEQVTHCVTLSLRKTQKKLLKGLKMMSPAASSDGVPVGNPRTVTSGKPSLVFLLFKGG